MKSDRSEVVTGIFGRGASLVLLALLCLFALSFSATTLAAFAGATFVLLIAVRVWGRLGLWRLDVDLSSGGSHLFAGESIALCAEIHNRKILPVWMRIDVAFSPAFVPVAGEGQGAVEGETGLLPFGTMTASWTFKATRRGFHRLGPASVLAGDLLGLWRRGRKLDFQRDIVVFPRLLRLAALELPFRDFFGIHPVTGIVEDPARYEGSREYSGNRPAKYIHWKASARLSILQEKIFEPTSQMKIFFLFDGEGFEDPDDPAGFEKALELLGSLASRFAETGASFAVATDRSVRAFPAALPPGRGPQQLGMVLELLARCERRKGQAIKRLLEGMGSAGSAGVGGIGSGFIVICRSRDEAARKYRDLPAWRKDRLTIVFSEKGEDGEEGDIPGLSFKELCGTTGGEG